MNALCDYLIKNQIKTISEHELSGWPIADVEALKSANYIQKAENSNRIYCDSCDESCPIDDYEIIEVPDKGKMAAFTCPEKDEMGFITVSLSRRRQWKINSEKLESAFAKDTSTPAKSENKLIKLTLNSNQCNNGKSVKMLSSVVNDSSRQGIKCEERSFKSFKKFLKAHNFPLQYFDYERKNKTLKTIIPVGGITFEYIKSEKSKKI